jgi:hypothetical protein
MTLRNRTLVLASLIVLGGALTFPGQAALAQGPYGGNTYADFPYNQGSMAYRPVRPAASRPLTRSVAPAVQYYYHPPTATQPAGYYSYQPVKRGLFRRGWSYRY